jgi:hypothetical protein
MKKETFVETFVFLLWLMYGEQNRHNQQKGDKGRKYPTIHAFRGTKDN